MILDAIIALLAPIIAAIVGGVTAVSYLVLLPAANLLLAGVEAVISLFVSGFQLGRFKGRAEKPSAAATAGGALVLMLIVGLLGWLVVAPRVMNRKVAFVAEDGHSLPFAAVIIHTSGGNEHRRTDNAGNLVIPRFNISGLTIKDPRYVEQTWPKSGITRELTVSRTKLGASLDSLADRLLAPDKTLTRALLTSSLPPE